MDWDNIITVLLVLAVWLAADLPLGWLIGKFIHFGHADSPDCRCMSASLGSP